MASASGGHALRKRRTRPPQAADTRSGSGGHAGVAGQNAAVRPRPVLLAAAIVLAALNLRPAVASVGPVLPELRDGLRLSGTQTAVLTMLPVLCFGALAPAAPRLARRAGIEVVLMGALVTLVAALAGRVLGGAGLLFAGTVVAGGAIAVANVLLPPLIKRDFPAHTGPLMGIYTMSVAGSAAFAAGATVPGGELLGSGWRGGLALWAALAAVAAVVWLPMLHGRTRPPPEAVAGSVLRSALAWQVTVFFGLQSFQFYAVLAWLPSIYRDYGFSPAAAGLLLSLSGLVQIPVTLLLPAVAARTRDQVALIVVSTAVLGVGLAGVVLAPTTAPYLWVALIGVGYGGCFALALALFVLRATGVHETARLSAMAQTVGYLISSCGPLAFGMVHELTGSWGVPLVLLIVLLVPQLWCGALAGRARVLAGRDGPAAGSPPRRRPRRRHRRRQGDDRGGGVAAAGG